RAEDARVVGHAVTCGLAAVRVGAAGWTLHVRGRELAGEPMGDAALHVDDPYHAALLRVQTSTSFAASTAPRRYPTCSGKSAAIGHGFGNLSQRRSMCRFRSGSGPSTNAVRECRIV